MVRNDGSRIYIQTKLGIKSTSQLVVKNAQPSDSGVYTCTPAHSKEKSVAVHVLTGGSFSITIYKRQWRSPNLSELTKRYINLIILFYFKSSRYQYL